jgi:hypothetical protein
VLHNQFPRSGEATNYIRRIVTALSLPVVSTARFIADGMCRKRGTISWRVPYWFNIFFSIADQLIQLPPAPDASASQLFHLHLCSGEREGHSW